MLTLRYAQTLTYISNKATINIVPDASIPASVQELMRFNKEQADKELQEMRQKLNRSEEANRENERKIEALLQENAKLKEQAQSAKVRSSTPYIPSLSISFACRVGVFAPSWPRPRLGGAGGEREYPTPSQWLIPPYLAIKCSHKW